MLQRQHCGAHKCGRYVFSDNSEKLLAHSTFLDCCVQTPSQDNNPLADKAKCKGQLHKHSS